MGEGFSRRAALRLCGVTLAGAAGCASQSPAGPESESPTAVEPTYANELDAPATRTFRNPSGAPAVRSSAHDAEENVSESELGVRGLDRRYETGTGGARVRRCGDRRGGHPGVRRADEPRFRDGTRPPVPCRTRTLERLRWTPVDEPVAGGVDLVLEYDERKETCERGGAKASEATVVRLPGGFERVVSFGYRY